MPRRNLHIVLIAAVLSILCYHQASRNRYATVIADALGAIHSQYIEPVDNHDLFNSAMHGMVDGLDQYSEYIDPEAYRDMKSMMEQSLSGVGIEVTMNDETKQLVVVSPKAGTPAYEAGVSPGDVIVAVDGQSTQGWELREAVKAIRGPAGTPISLTVERKGEPAPLDLNMQRAEITIESALGDTRERVWAAINAAKH